MDTAAHYAAVLAPFLSGCVINALNINVLCLFKMHTGASTELPLATNRTSMYY